MSVNRRDFLKLLGVGSVIGAASGAGLGTFVAKNYPNEIIELKGKLGLSPEGQKKLDEIVLYRKSLGLDGLPPEYLISIITPEEYTAIKPFDNQLPEKNISYGLRISEVLSAVLGHNATKNVKGARFDEKYPDGISFDGNSRYCNVSDSVHDIPIYEFTDYVIHEAVGHGTDTACGAKYPPEILASFEHGKWRALSQCFSIPDQFLNHPNDLMFPLFKTELGATVGWFMNGKDNSPISDLSSLPLIQKEVFAIAYQMGKDPRTLKYNKATCKQIGEKVIEMQRGGQIKIAGPLKNSYQYNMEQIGIEIYAEMVKCALLYPQYLNGNQDVIHGIKEVIDSIGGNPDWKEIYDVISKPNGEVVDRNIAEVNALNKEEISVGPTLTPAQADNLEQQERSNETVKSRFGQFVQEGKWPDNMVINDDQMPIMSNFASCYCQILSRYPMLRDTFAQQYNENFDPDLNIWDIQKIENAIDSGFIRGLLKVTNISSDLLNDLNNRLKVFQDFINSPAF